MSKVGQCENIVAILTENSVSGLQLDKVREMQNKDQNLRPIIMFLSDVTLPVHSVNARKVAACAPDYELFNGILYHYWTPGSRR